VIVSLLILTCHLTYLCSREAPVGIVVKGTQLQ